MTIQNTIELFKNFSIHTNKKSELKIHENFIQILSDLETRNLSANEIHSIEIELDTLELNSNPDKRKKHVKNALHNFKSYLKNNFSLITKGHYTAIGMMLGLFIGSIIGSLIEDKMGISGSLSIAMLIGLLIGRYFDTQAEKEGRVLRTKS